MEFCPAGGKSKKMHGGAEEVADEVKRLQEYAVYRHRARRAKLGPSDEMSFAVVDDGGSTRYELVVVDSDVENPPHGPVGVFIVPRGMLVAFPSALQTTSSHNVRRVSPSLCFSKGKGLPVRNEGRATELGPGCGLRAPDHRTSTTEAVLREHY